MVASPFFLADAGSAADVTAFLAPHALALLFNAWGGAEPDAVDAIMRAIYRDLIRERTHRAIYRTGTVDWSGRVSRETLSAAIAQLERVMPLMDVA